MDAKVPVRVGVKTARKLNISHSFFMNLAPTINRMIANKAEKSSNMALKSGKPEVVASIFR